jgi:hypothetical protein
VAWLESQEKREQTTIFFRSIYLLTKQHIITNATGKEKTFWLGSSLCLVCWASPLKIDFRQIRSHSTRDAVEPE